MLARTWCEARSRRRLLLLASLVSLVSVAACSNIEKKIADNTKLEGPGKGDLGRELEVRVSGSSLELARDFVTALSQDLEAGD
ncbi:hypothetical protein HY251_09170, partial [bacterium]|nr:hypothetical protein [bacterium]